MSSLLRKLLLLIIATAIPLLAVEMALHLLDYPPRQTDFRQFSEVDPVRGWRNVAGRSGEYISDEYRHTLRYNSWATRGPEFDAAKDSGAVRLLLLGDSFTDAYSVAENERINAVLAHELQRRVGCRVEALALGNAGYATDQELLWYREVGTQLDPDMVVLLFYYNDIWYNGVATYQGIPKPLFAVAGDSVVLAQTAAQSAEARGATARVARPTQNPRLVAWLASHSRLYRLVERAVKNNPPLRALAVRVGIAAPPPEAMQAAAGPNAIPPEFSVFQPNPPAATQRAWDLTAALLRQLQRDVTRDEARFLVFHVPFRGLVHTESQRGLQLEQRGLELSEVGKRLLQICTQSRIACLDPTAQFAARAQAMASNGDRLYYNLDTHWNAAGHELAARLLADALEKDVRARCIAAAAITPTARP